MLFLFSIGVTKGKWGSLLTDAASTSSTTTTRQRAARGSSARRWRPAPRQATAAWAWPTFAREMHETMRGPARWHALQAAASDVLPTPAMTERRRLSRTSCAARSSRCSSTRSPSRVVAVGVVPYPPGIPLLMPGERAGERRRPVLGYLAALQSSTARFPGFEHDMHGVEHEDGDYVLYCRRERRCLMAARRQRAATPQRGRASRARDREEGHSGRLRPGHDRRHRRAQHPQLPVAWPKRAGPSITWYVLGLSLFFLPLSFVGARAGHRLAQGRRRLRLGAARRSARHRASSHLVRMVGERGLVPDRARLHRRDASPT